MWVPKFSDQRHTIVNKHAWQPNRIRGIPLVLSRGLSTNLKELRANLGLAGKIPQGGFLGPMLVTPLNQLLGS